MAIAPPPTRFTPEDLLTMPHGDRYELVDGQLVEKSMGNEADWIAGEVFRRLANFVAEERLGWAYPETSYQCFDEDPARVRRPVASFIGSGRLPQGRLPSGHCRIAPDLAVEVVSPNDTFSEVQVKVEEYLRAGVRVVWLVDPAARIIEVVRGGGQPQRLHESDELRDDELLPGFRCRVGDLFPSDADTL